MKKIFFINTYPLAMLQLRFIFVALWLFFGAGIGLSSAYAMLNLELTQGIDAALPIAIMPFSDEALISSPDNNIRAVIGHDLENSGRFKLADVSNLLPALGKGNINYDFWRQKKVGDAVTGQIESVGGGSYKVSFQLLDVYNKTKLLDLEYKVPEARLRALAHHISDLIYAQLTGDRGIFSTRIAYVMVSHDGGARYNLEVSDVDGYNSKILLTSDQPLMSPSWSPDGKRIAYVSFEGNRAGIYLQDVASGRRQLLSKYPGINGAPAWSPDGSKMALVLSTTGYPKIYILNLATKKLEQMTSDWYLDTEPSWAPDGKSIIFTSNRGGTPQIYRLYIDSKKIERLTYQGPYNARAFFTSDGKNIVMLHQSGDLFNIAIQDLSSSRIINLTAAGYNESPSIAPNGKMVVYATNTDGRGMLALVSTDGKVKLSLPSREGEVREPAWSPFSEDR